MTFAKENTTPQHFAPPIDVDTTAIEVNTYSKENTTRQHFTPPIAVNTNKHTSTQTPTSAILDIYKHTSSTIPPTIPSSPTPPPLKKITTAMSMKDTLTNAGTAVTVLITFLSLSTCIHLIALTIYIYKFWNKKKYNITKSILPSRIQLESIELQPVEFRNYENSLNTTQVNTYISDSFESDESDDIYCVPHTPV